MLQVRMVSHRGVRVSLLALLYTAKEILSPKQGGTLSKDLGQGSRFK